MFDLSLHIFSLVVRFFQRIVPPNRSRKDFAHEILFLKTVHNQHWSICLDFAATGNTIKGREEREREEREREREGEREGEREKRREKF